MSVNKEPLPVDRKEICRYLGYRGHEADEATKQLVEVCVRELLRVAEPKYVRREYPVKVLKEGTLDLGCFQTNSKNLMKNLGGCGQVLLMAVTLGLEVDRLLMRYGKLNVTKAVVLQAAAAAMIESCCNRLCLEWKTEYEARGRYLRPRYSPGYGDFSLDFQKRILEELYAGRQIGITLTDGCLMVPTKSVTAVIGISETEHFCQVEGCEACENAACLYRRSSAEGT